MHGPYPAASTPSSSPETSTYGPVRVRQQKGPEMFVFRPVQTQAEDLIDALQEMSEERSEAHKRPASREPSADPPHKRARTEDSSSDCLLAQCVAEQPDAGVEVFCFLLS